MFHAVGHGRTDDGDDGACWFSHFEFSEREMYKWETSANK